MEPAQSRVPNGDAPAMVALGQRARAELTGRRAIRQEPERRLRLPAIVALPGGRRPLARSAPCRPSELSFAHLAKLTLRETSCPLVHKRLDLSCFVMA